MVLFDGEVVVKAVKLAGVRPIVRFVNGEIITAAEGGKLTVLNQELQVVESFYETKLGDIRMAGNQYYIASADTTGVVRFYNRGGQSKVSLFCCCSAF